MAELRARDQLRPALPAPASSVRRQFMALGAVPLSLGVLAIVCLLALTQGAAPIPVLSAVRIILASVPGLDSLVDASTEPEAWRRIVLDVRLPRVAAAAVIGATLSFTGAGYQGVFRNPLANEYLLGVASGAALGAALVIISPLGTGGYGFGPVPLAAFAGGGLTVTAVYVLSKSAGGGSATTLILAGVALSSLLSAITSFIMIGAGQRAQPIFAFLFGTLNISSWERLAWGAPYLVVGGAIVLAHGRVLNVLQLDEEQARQLGINVSRAKFTVLAASSLMAATAVAIAGVIGFVGLVVPHVVRLLWGSDYRRLLPLSAIVGAVFLVATDLVGRTIFAPQEVPVGIVTAIAGGPFFLYLLRNRRMAHI
ncbi:MAG: iron ABC transporter permease [Dehalococcoidia bacterium]|nr:iron ABC transporter permease [Dehalococcoidia bacterium]